MKAMQLNNSKQGPALLSADLPTPVPGPGEILIRVRAAGVTPTELIWYPTLHTRTGEDRLHAVPGHEFSGEIAAVGQEVTAVSTGQQVHGLNDWFDDGAESAKAKELQMTNCKMQIAN
jgi:NADPH:quinone reductase-like Zn-dependent oxidoreductase